MKFNTLALSAVIASACFASSAMASDGTINFEGELVATTCDISVDGKPSPALVTLPTLSVGNLNAEGMVAGATGFNIGLENCEGVTATTSSVAAFFENGATVDFNSYNLINTAAEATAATNVQLQLLDAQTGSQIHIGNTDQTVNTTRFDVSTGSTVLPYAVQYYATAATTPGLVTSAVNFSIDYQ